MTDNDEGVVLVEILFRLVVHLAVDSKNACVKLVRSIANVGALDPGVLGVKQVTVDVIAQLARQWEVCSHGLTRRVVRRRGCDGLRVVCAELIEVTDRR